ncbi:MAG: NnrU family protein [Xanthobacteraceae bacterium]|nr:NnrU family protein [Xanthobacteraceae bacterium]
MTLMLAGLFVFIAAHGFTTLRGPRTAVIARIGEGPYKILYALVSIAGVLMIGYGFGAWRARGPVELWYPPVWTRHIAMALMLFASIAMVATYAPGRIKAALKHPMLVAVKAWAVAHLLANGDFATIVLAVVVLAWAVFARISMKWREPAAPVAATGWIGDAVALVGGLALYAFLAYLLHPYVIGVPVLPA